MSANEMMRRLALLILVILAVAAANVVLDR
jgi:hypothetical protein